MAIFKRRSASSLDATRSERLQLRKLARGRLRRHRVVLALVVLVGAVVATTAHAIPTTCDSGITFSMNETVIAPSDPQPTLDVARVGDTIDYRVIVSLGSNQCPFADGTITITHPGGLTQTLVTGVSATPGAPAQTFDENTVYSGQTPSYQAYVVSDADTATNGSSLGVNATSAITATGTQTDNSTFDDGANTGRFVRVIHPETALTKTATPLSGSIDLPVTYTFDEANNSDSGPDAGHSSNLLNDAITGSSIVIGDTGTGACSPIDPVTSGGFNTGDANTNGLLDPGETFHFSCDTSYSSVGSFSDTASASGNAQDGREAGTVASSGAPHDEASAEITVTTSKATPDLSTTPDPGSGGIPQTLNDSATISGLVNPDGTGTITFNLYGPGDTTCSTSLFTVDLTVDSGNGTYTTTTGPSESNAGTYTWLASFSGDSNNNPVAAPACADGEQVLLSPATPELGTTPQPATGTIPQTLNDSATLSGLVNPITSGGGEGSITFNLYGPGDTTCSTSLFTVTIPADSGNGTYTTTTGPSESTAGTYTWLASYSGDANNNPVAAPACADGEQVLLSPATPDLSTTPQPESGLIPQTLNDSATISGLVNPDGTGTITFNLYGPGDTTCSTSLFTVTLTVDSGNGTYTTTTGPSESTAGTYTWLASFSGDANNNPVAAPACADGEQVLLEKPTPGLTTTPQPASGSVPQTLNDSATISGLVNPDGTGTITFNLYGPGDTTCSTSLFTVTLTVDSGNGTYTTTTGPSESTPGTYTWLASFSGDANNNPVAAPACADGEQVILTQQFTNNLTPGFWKTHQAATQALLPQTLGNHVVSTFAEAKTILSGMGCGSVGALNCMAGMLLAADLNLAQGGSTCILPVVSDANALLIKYSYSGFGTYTLTNADKTLAMTLHDELSAYNIDGVPTC